MKNLYIIIGFCFGLLCFFYSNSYKSFEKSQSFVLGIILPIILLWILFRYKVIGAGDIKLFSVIGSLYGCPFIIKNMILALFSGAILSVIHFIRQKDFLYRLSYFKSFISRQNSIKKFLLEPIPYYEREQEGYSAVMPFTVAITIGFLLARYGKFDFGI